MLLMTNHLTKALTNHLTKLLPCIERKHLYSERKYLNTKTHVESIDKSFDKILSIQLSIYLSIQLSSFCG